ncbi:uncharacterized protein MYCFIDRAFT_85718 [Pseudocercospora fijiensis CIRAD86]|uniref:Uncharacterized protein n=1 Tax=Pseudocercospora fijiensis (strain CIRAD86) TaxID=383855 RepID=N1Q9H2_PSEFD|nr:uncharacterized protein MYCFIDRAFT_85718 [Pseudocercospora fijiensis CIRAD86]EME87538.1 hypothetical protein MYCFIDRAFT_85718 [Pseudocercospora fijiensis CIRAD86]
MAKANNSHLPFFRSPLMAHEGSGASSNTEDNKTAIVQPYLEEQSDDAAFHDHPQFRRHAEATNAELFYDLFFVANLTVFTNVHEVGLYDVRFSTDSVFERTAKYCQFLVMMGFAIIGPKFNVGKHMQSSGEDDADEEGPALPYFKALTLVLMASRLVLVFQYVVSLWFTRHYKQTILPMCLMAGTYFIAAIIYLGIFWSFHSVEQGSDHTYIAWYVVAILETIVATSVSSIWRNISFKGTHLIQRMSLLTLIILGEGVMGLAEKCQRIVHSEGALSFTASTVGNIICAVAIYYFLYMLYFDWIEEDHFGTIRQQIWSFLHFPLHLALVLAVEGVAQCVTWRAAIVRGNEFTNQINTWAQIANETNPNWTEIATQLNDTVQDLVYKSLLTTSSLSETSEILTYTYPNAINATQVVANGTADPEAAWGAVEWSYYTLYTTILNIAGFAGSENSTELNVLSNTIVDFSDEKASDESSDALVRAAGVFDLTFVYFFTTVGLVVILCCLLAALSKREKTWMHWIRLVVSGLLGLALCLLSIMDLTDAGGNFAFSPWVLPLVAICLFAVVVLNSVKPAVPVLSRVASRKSVSM